METFLHGSEEDMRKQAEGLKKRTERTSIPENPWQGQGNSGTSKTSIEDWGRKLLGKN